jgi:hypothetical protein
VLTIGDQVTSAGLSLLDLGDCITDDQPNRDIAAPYDPYSLLRSLEDMFGFTPLGHAGRATSFMTAALPGA